MTLDEFHASIQLNKPPLDLNQLLLALWYDAKGDWEKSHSIIQVIETKDAALIHAYLHRKEGDEWNADYWYRMAGANRSSEPLEDEWASLADKFLLQQSPT